MTQKQADVVRPLEAPHRLGDLRAEDVHDILTELGFADPTLSSKEFQLIASQANQQINPYSNG